MYFDFLILAGIVTYFMNLHYCT